jgi:hypothetical protein
MPVYPGAFPDRNVVNHITELCRSRTTNGGGRKAAAVDWLATHRPYAVGVAVVGVAPSVRWMSGFICCSC